MRQIRELPRLAHEGVGAREIGRVLGLAPSTVQDNRERARASGLGWPLAPELTDDALEARLYQRSGLKPGA